MNKRIFLISKFEGQKQGLNYFHFNGHYKGWKIKKVLLNEGTFEQGEEYILAIDELKVEGECLYAKLVKFKLLFT